MFKRTFWIEPSRIYSSMFQTYQKPRLTAVDSSVISYNAFWNRISRHLFGMEVHC